ncbi:hypothetical protein [Sphingomonas sp. UYP23]
MAFGVGGATALVVSQQMGDGILRHRSLAMPASARSIVAQSLAVPTAPAVVTSAVPAMTAPRSSPKRPNWAAIALYRENRERLARETLAHETNSQMVDYTDVPRDGAPAVHLEGEALRHAIIADAEATRKANSAAIPVQNPPR